MARLSCGASPPSWAAGQAYSEIFKLGHQSSEKVPTLSGPCGRDAPLSNRAGATRPLSNRAGANCGAMRQWRVKLTRGHGTGLEGAGAALFVKLSLSHLGCTKIRSA